MGYKRRGRGWRVAQRVLVGLGIILFFVSVVVLSIRYIEPANIASDQGYIIQPIVKVDTPKEEEIPQTPVDYIREVDNPSSEIKGEWLGLCEKGSIHTVEDFKSQVYKDDALYNHFRDFQWDRAVVRHLEEPAKANVSHRKGEHILPSKKLITLPKGDGYITDGNRIVRTHCCNDVKPVEKDDFQPYTPPPKDLRPVPVYDLITNDDMAPRPQTYSIPPPQSYAYHGGGGGHRHFTPPEPPPPSPVPEPETWLLFGTGTLMLGLKKFLTWIKR